MKIDPAQPILRQALLQEMARRAIATRGRTEAREGEPGNAEPGVKAGRKMDHLRRLKSGPPGAIGWMQFMPATWEQYGLDVNRDGVKDPYNPVDAIFSAARYLHAAGAQTDIRKAVFAYNHAGWYVDSVLLRARLLGGLPANLVTSLSGLVEGRFPLHSRAAYDTRTRSDRTHADLRTRAGAPVVAVNDGRIVRTGRTKRLGRYVELQDVYGNTYRYGHVSRIREQRGARVAAGDVLGYVEGGANPSLRFEIRPAGPHARRIDPTPILDGWKLLESTAIYRARGRDVLQEEPSIGQIMLMSKAHLQRHVLADARIDIYPCGRDDVRDGLIDRRVLATLGFLSASGFRVTVTSLRCGHGYYTASGSVSEHSSGNAVDIAAINGIPVLGHQGPGSTTEQLVQRLLTLQGLMKPHQIISLTTFPGADNAFVMGDHADHVHVGWRPLFGTNTRAARQVDAILTPAQWTDLIERLATIDNPVVPHP